MPRERLGTTSNSSVYNRIHGRYIIKQRRLCLYCYIGYDSVYGGENYTRKSVRSWKKYRNYQYKNIADMTIYPSEDCHESQ